MIDVWDASYERDQVKLIEHLGQRKGYDFTVISSSHDDNFKHRNKRFFASLDMRFSNTKIMHNPSISIKLPNLHPIVLYSPSLNMFGNYDILHAYGLGSYSSFLASTIKKLNPKLRMVMRSDLSWRTFERMLASERYGRLVLAPLRSSDGVYAYTEKELGYLRRLGLCGRKIRKIPVGIAYSQYDRARARKAVRWGSEQACKRDGKGLRLGFLGRIHYDKGPDRLAEPLKRLASAFPEIEIRFAGPMVDDAYGNRLLEEMRMPQFEYLGMLSKAQLVDYLGDTDILFMPSRVETGAIVELEAMASGCAVIAIDDSPMSEYIDDGESGLLAKDENAIYEKAKLLVEDPNLMMRLGNAAQKKAREYDWETIADMIAKFYADVLGACE